MVFGAVKGRVNCCSRTPWRIRLIIEGPAEATEPAAPITASTSDEPWWDGRAVRRSLRPHGARTSWSPGSLDSDHRIRRIALIPSSSA